MERLFVAEGDSPEEVGLETGLEGRGYLKAQQPLRVGKHPEPAEKRYCACSLRTGGQRP